MIWVFAVRFTPVPVSVPDSVSEAVSVKSPPVALSDAPAFTAIESPARFTEAAEYCPLATSVDSADATSVPVRATEPSRKTDWFALELPTTSMAATEAVGNDHMVVPAVTSMFAPADKIVAVSLAAL